MMEQTVHSLKKVMLEIEAQLQLIEARQLRNRDLQRQLQRYLKKDRQPSHKAKWPPLNCSVPESSERYFSDLKEFQEINQTMPFHFRSSFAWRPEELAQLRQAIKVVATQRLQLQHFEQATDNSEDLECLQRLLNISPEEIAVEVSNFNLKDWLSVANLCQTGHTAEQCCICWHNHESPAVNKSSWTPKEESRLVQLVNTVGEHDWGTVARKLATCRTPVQCLTRWVRCHHQFLNCGWTDAEEKALQAAVLRVGDCNWMLVADALESFSGEQRRTAGQCFQRWRVSPYNPNNSNKLSWSKADDLLLYLCYSAYYERSWVKIGQHFPGRGDTVLRERWTNVCDPNLFHRKSWTLEEDAALLKAVEEQGVGQWSAVATMIEGRSDSMCRRRWLQLFSETSLEVCQKSAGKEHLPAFQHKLKWPKNNALKAAHNRVQWGPDHCPPEVLTKWEFELLVLQKSILMPKSLCQGYFSTHARLVTSVTSSMVHLLDSAVRQHQLSVPQGEHHERPPGPSSPTSSGCPVMENEEHNYAAQSSSSELFHMLAQDKEGLLRVLKQHNTRLRAAQLICPVTAIEPSVPSTVQIPALQCDPCSQLALYKLLYLLHFEGASRPVNEAPWKKLGNEGALFNTCSYRFEEATAEVKPSELRALHWQITKRIAKAQPDATSDIDAVLHMTSYATQDAASAHEVHCHNENGKIIPRTAATPGSLLYDLLLQSSPSSLHASGKTPSLGQTHDTSSFNKAFCSPQQSSRPKKRKTTAVAPSNGCAAPSNGCAAPSNGRAAKSNMRATTSNGRTATSNGHAATSNRHNAPSNGRKDQRKRYNSLPLQLVRHPLPLPLLPALPPLPFPLPFSPAPTNTAASVSVPALVPAPSPTPALAPVRASTPTAAPTPVPTAVPAPVPAPAQIPVSTATPVPAPVFAPVSIPTPAPTPAPAPAPDLACTSAPAPAAAPVPTPLPSHSNVECPSSTKDVPTALASIPGSVQEHLPPLTHVQGESCITPLSAVDTLAGHLKTMPTVTADNANELPQISTQPACPPNELPLQTLQPSIAPSSPPIQLRVQPTIHNPQAVNGCNFVLQQGQLRTPGHLPVSLQSSAQTMHPNGRQQQPNLQLSVRPMLPSRSMPPYAMPPNAPMWVNSFMHYSVPSATFFPHNPSMFMHRPPPPRGPSIHLSPSPVPCSPSPVTPPPGPPVPQPLAPVITPTGAAPMQGLESHSPSVTQETNPAVEPASARPSSLIDGLLPHKESHGPPVDSGESPAVAPEDCRDWLFWYTHHQIHAQVPAETYETDDMLLFSHIVSGLFGDTLLSLCASVYEKDPTTVNCVLPLPSAGQWNSKREVRLQKFKEHLQKFEKDIRIMLEKRYKQNLEKTEEDFVSKVSDIFKKYLREMEGLTSSSSKCDMEYQRAIEKLSLAQDAECKKWQKDHETRNKLLTGMHSQTLKTLEWAIQLQIRDLEQSKSIVLDESCAKEEVPKKVSTNSKPKHPRSSANSAMETQEPQSKRQKVSADPFSHSE